MLFEFEIRQGGDPRKVYSFLRYEEIQAFGGLEPPGVVAFEDEHGEVVVNAVFREFLQKTIEELAPSEMESAAREAGNGRVVYVDDRAPEHGAVAREDILGWFRVENGQVTGYEPNPAHALFSRDRGWSHAISKFRDAMRERLTA